LADRLTELPLLFGVVLLIFAALHDVAARTIPNTIAALVAVCGLAARLGAGDATISVCVAGLVFGVAFLLWLRGFLGGGDVKLLGACAILVPPHAVLSMVLDIAIAGGALAAIYLCLRVAVPKNVDRVNRPRSFVGRVLRAEQWRIHRNCPLPYASAIAAGVFISSWHG
jgi:prepilin peptidase CpaA